MAQGAGPLGRHEDDTPEAIHAAMRRTRSALSEHLQLLKDQLLHPDLTTTDTETHQTMATKKAAKKPGRGTAAASKRTKEGSDAASGARAKASKAAKASPAEPRSGSLSKTKRSTSGRGKAGASRKTVASDLVAKTTEVVEDMLTGAAVGAVTGAAARVQDQPTAVGTPDANHENGRRATKSQNKNQKRPSGSRSDVLTEMASGAALGAAAGAAKAILPDGKTKTPPAKPAK
jgi:hypothetical protein